MTCVIGEMGWVCNLGVHGNKSEKERKEMGVVRWLGVHGNKREWKLR